MSEDKSLNQRMLDDLLHLVATFYMDVQSVEVNQNIEDAFENFHLWYLFNNRTIYKFMYSMMLIRHELDVWLPQVGKDRVTKTINRICEEDLPTESEVIRAIKRTWINE